MKTTIYLLTALVATLGICTTAAGAESLYPTEPADFEVMVDGFDYEGEVLSVEDVAYVSLREFACMADNAVVWWDDATDTAYAKTASVEVRAPEDAFYIEANGRMLWCEYGVFTEDNVLYIPLGKAAKAFGFDTTYVYEENTTYLERKRSAIVPAEDYYEEDEVYWLSKIIHAESKGEPLNGKLAVGNVILNRVASAEFPDTIYGVIFDNDHGVQFTPTVNGAIHEDASSESVLAAKLCLDDAVLSTEILYFLNEKIASSLWVPENRKFVMAIGEHTFYS